MTSPFRFRHAFGCLAASAAVILPVAPALAETLSVTGDVSGSLTLTSDYRFRGISRTYGDPAIQGGAEFTLPSNFYIGTWGSIVDKLQFANTRGFEWDIYGGYRKVVGNDISIDVGLIQYMFPSESKFSTLEAYAGANWRWFTLKFYNSLSNRFFGAPDARDSRYISLGVTYPLYPDLNLIGQVGNQFVSGPGGDNIDYRLGVEKMWKGLAWSASYYGTDVDVATSNATGRSVNLGGNKLVVAVTKRF